ncbi:hypothetical protein PVK06_002015 [Gossypium arboreum]|uniref:Uncharacterized protein n=1 Tax=Gossypium arboreum TaxID=29729 RepID=A0ABR0R2I1_GOSAR|nr:hypothetical protein PVK06_002015 [Gossypium arboreum]
MEGVPEASSVVPLAQTAPKQYKNSSCNSGSKKQQQLEEEKKKEKEKRRRRRRRRRKKNRKERKIARQSIGSQKLTGKQNVIDIPWMDKLDVRKLPREFLISIPVIKIEEEEDPKESSNWIVEDEYEENQEYLNWIVQYFPEEDTGSEIEENVELNLNG